MPKIALTSDGTVEGTEVTLDGTKLTDDENVVSASFSASVNYSKYVMFDYSTKEEKDDGSYEVVSYSYYKPDDSEEDSYPEIRRERRPSGLGKDVAEDQEVLSSNLVLGARFHTKQVIDTSIINPNHRGIIAALIHGKPYTVVNGEE